MKITYIFHSGFLIELDDAYFLFDYYKGDIPYLNPQKKLFVFSSHAHHDHFNRMIFGLKRRCKEVAYILSSDIKHLMEDEGITIMGPDESCQVNECQVNTLKSTDEGVAFLIRYHGKTIYHAGDLNWWHWEEEDAPYNQTMKENYQHEVEKLSGETIDLAFVPVDLRLEEQFFWGLDWYMKHTDTKVVFPMHFWEDYKIFSMLREETQTESYRDKIVELKHPGDCFSIE